AFKGLEYFLVGGDMVHPGPVNRLRTLHDHLKIVHCYGPTENTTFSTTIPVDRHYPERIPIGRPINNSSVYIFDKHDNLQPIGVPGELCVGGDGVARGYLNNPELTAEKFEKIKLQKKGDSPEWEQLPGKQQSACNSSEKLLGVQNPFLEKGFGRRRHQHAAGPDLFKLIYNTGDLACWLPNGTFRFLGRIDRQVKVRGFRIELGEIE
ncbi:MAG: AMP-binding protein, partial [bacterium]|nr:AMP-binding protein [bacterium]